jgi:lipoprotein signal peptidase
MSLSKVQIGFISLIWVVLDFLTKNFAEQKTYVITNFLHLRFAREFARFDLIPQLASYSSQIAIVGSILSLIIMGYFYTKYYYRIILFAIGMIMAGILGNLIDKIYFGWSRVFIDIHHNFLLMFFDTPQVPLFNLADILIVWGALIFIFSKKW